MILSNLISILIALYFHYYILRLINCFLYWFCSAYRKCHVLICYHNPKQHTIIFSLQWLPIYAASHQKIWWVTVRIKIVHYKSTLISWSICYSLLRIMRVELSDYIGEVSLLMNYITNYSPSRDTDNYNIIEHKYQRKNFKSNKYLVFSFDLNQKFELIILKKLF